MRRLISGRAAPSQLADTLASLFLAELLRPSPRLFVHTAWLANAPLLDNRFNAYRTYLPDLGFRVITLTDVLVELSRRGADLELAVTDGKRSQAFLDLLRTLLVRSPGRGRIRLLSAEDLPGTGVLGDDFWLEGAFLWSSAGVTPGPTPAVLHTSAGDVAEARKQWTAFWEGCADDAQPLP
jgi:hypothetical protein